MDYITTNSYERLDCETKYKQSILLNKGPRKTIYEACIEDNCSYVMKVSTYHHQKDFIGVETLSREYLMKMWEMEITGYSRIMNCENRYNVFTQNTQLVPKLYDYWYRDTENGDTIFYLVMEKYDGNLTHFMKKYKYNHLLNTLVKQALLNLTSALYFINNNCGICLNNIKLEHILYKYRGNGYYDFSFGDLGESSIALHQICKDKDLRRFNETIKMFLDHLNNDSFDQNLTRDDIFFYHHYPELLGPKLGGGMFGSVFVDDTDPNLCIKMTKNKDNDCKRWSSEYHTIKKIEESIKDKEPYKKLKLVRLMIPTVFKDDSSLWSLCYMKMPRIYRPLLKDDPISKEFTTLQVQLGSGNLNLKSPKLNQGEYIGLTHIRKYMDELDLENACFELGVTMGLIHFVGRQNALDIEVFLGREYRSNQVRFYIADFDTSTEIKQFDEKAIQEMVASLADKPYFPKKISDEKLFYLFYQGYASIVPRPIVEKIFSYY